VVAVESTRGNEGAQSRPTTHRIGDALRYYAFPLTLLAVFLGYHMRLASVLISDQDEGTYLYQGRLIAEGLVPYRDFFIAHPPLVPLYGAFAYLVFGDSLALTRALYAVLVLLLASPIFFIVRAQTRSAAAGTLGFVTYGAGILAVANMGRTVRLEPVMAGLLVLAFSLALRRGTEPRWRVLIGALMALALLTKLTAAIPIALFAAFELIEARRAPWKLIRPWSAQLLGAVLVLGLALAYLLPLEGFINDVWVVQATRPPLPFAVRFAFFSNNVLRYPPLTIGLLAGAYYLFRAPSREVRAFSVLAVGGVVLMVGVMPTYLRFYIVLLLPYVAIVFAVWSCSIARVLIPRVAGPLLGIATCAGLLAIVAYGEVYHRTADQQVSSPARIKALLEGQAGPLYTMYPGYGLVTGIPLTRWPYVADSYLPRATGQVDEDDFIEVFARSNALVLWHGEFDVMPRAKAVIERDFARQYEDPYWALWTRKVPLESPSK
jgi:4-amino-4-deoxy-L-arabinose transferase-like glycosyltransferase